MYISKFTADGTFGEVHLARLEVAGDSGYLVAVKEPRCECLLAPNIIHTLSV